MLKRFRWAAVLVCAVAPVTAISHVVARAVLAPTPEVLYTALGIGLAFAASAGAAILHRELVRTLDYMAGGGEE